MCQFKGEYYLTGIASFCNLKNIIGIAKMKLISTMCVKTKKRGQVVSFDPIFLPSDMSHN